MYEKFRYLCDINHVTVRDVANATGLNESSLSNWKKRKGGINTDTLIALCKYFNVSSDWFLDLTIEVVNPKPANISKRILAYAQQLCELPPESIDSVLEQIELQKLKIANKKGSALGA